MLPGKRWIAGFSRNTSSEPVGIGPRDRARVEAAQTLLQLQRPEERGRHRHLLVEDEPDQERERLGGDQPVGLRVPGEVQRLGHDSILPLPGMSLEMADPIEKTEDLAAEAEQGRSERTPWLVLGGVHIAVRALVAARARDRLRGRTCSRSTVPTG